MEQASSTALRCLGCSTELMKKPGGGKPKYCPPCLKDRRRIQGRDAARRRKAGIVLEPLGITCSDCQNEFFWARKGSPPERCETCRVEHHRRYLKNWQRTKGHLASGMILEVECRTCGSPLDWVVVVGRRPYICGICQWEKRAQRRRERKAARQKPDLSRRCEDCRKIYFRRTSQGGPTYRCKPCQKRHTARLDEARKPAQLAALREKLRLRYEKDGRSSPCQGCVASLRCQRMGLVRKWCGKCLPIRRREVAKAWRAANPEAMRDISYRSNQARRARLAAVEREPYKKSDILKRDNWTCKLCRKRINKRFKGRHSLAPTVDHQIPLEHGGADKPQNLVAAHMGCNSAKGSRFLPQGEQLQLC